MLIFYTFVIDNHSLELVPNADGIVPMDEIIARTDIMLEVDTFWIYNSRIDPVEFIEKHKDRISTVHLKDGIESSPEDFAAHANRGTQNKALGEGNVPVRAILKKAEELGFTVVVVIRCVAAHYNLNLPRIEKKDRSEEL